MEVLAGDFQRSFQRFSEEFPGVSSGFEELSKASGIFRGVKGVSMRLKSYLVIFFRAFKGVSRRFRVVLMRFKAFKDGSSGFRFWK